MKSIFLAALVLSGAGAGAASPCAGIYGDTARFHRSRALANSFESAAIFGVASLALVAKKAYPLVSVPLVAVVFGPSMVFLPTIEFERMRFASTVAGALREASGERPGNRLRRLRDLVAGEMPLATFARALSELDRDGTLCPDQNKYLDRSHLAEAIRTRFGP